MYKIMSVSDLTDSSPEGVKIIQWDNFRRKSVPENNRRRIEGVLIVLYARNVYVSYITSSRGILFASVFCSPFLQSFWTFYHLH